jgi:hypothetical protein
MKRLPKKLRNFLLSEMCEFPNPQEMLDNVRQHGAEQTLAVMALFNAHVIRVKYGPDHPSISKLMAIHTSFMETGKCPKTPHLATSAPKRGKRNVATRQLFRRNPVLNPPTQR